MRQYCSSLVYMQLIIFTVTMSPDCQKPQQLFLLWYLSHAESLRIASREQYNRIKQSSCIITNTLCVHTILTYRAYGLYDTSTNIFIARR